MMKNAKYYLAIYFSVCFRNQLLSAGLELVLSQTEKSRDRKSCTE